MSTDLPKLVLASGSPRRRELLETLGLEFEIRPPDVEELHESGEGPDAYVRRLASSKARAIGNEGEVVLAADTIVVLEDEILEKPTDRDDAAAMLQRLSDREHRVLTSVSLWDVSADASDTEVEESRVRMRPLTPDEIGWYVDTGEPDDKAGSYALQGIGAIFVAGITGSSSNVIGLPLTLVYDLFGRLGHDLKRFCTAQRPAGAVDIVGQ